jgi:hypothetical protein
MSELEDAQATKIATAKIIISFCDILKLKALKLFKKNEVENKF